VAVVFVTGMSGTGKSAALAELGRRGYRVVDTDYGGYSEEVPSSAEGGREQLWRGERIDALLVQRHDGVLLLSGCVANQGKFYPRFDAVVLLSAPVDVILERVTGRETNDFGKTDEERKRILHTWKRSSRFCVQARPPRSIRERRSTRLCAPSSASLTAFPSGSDRTASAV
jgi:shikimate kinase